MFREEAELDEAEGRASGRTQQPKGVSGWSHVMQRMRNVTDSVPSGGSETPALCAFILEPCLGADRNMQHIS